MDVGMMGMIIALVAVLGSFILIGAIVIVSIRARNQRNQMLHQERMMAIEKGLPVPPDYLDRLPRRRPYVRGLTFAGLGIGLMVFGWINAMEDGDWDLLGIGVVFLCIGLGMLIGDRLTMKKQNGWDASTSSYPAVDVGRPAEENRS